MNFDITIFTNWAGENKIAVLLERKDNNLIEHTLLECQSTEELKNFTNTLYNEVYRFLEECSICELCGNIYDEDTLPDTLKGACICSECLRQNT